MFMPSALSKSVDRIARRAAGKDWNLYAALFEQWQEIVGAEYARVTTPVKITFPHQPNEPRRINGILCVRLPKGLVMEMNFRTEQIRQRVNAYFGYPVVARITFDPVHEIPAPAAAPPPAPDPAARAHIHETAGGVESEALRQALEGFGEAVLARQAAESAQ
jgi:hypothetical protein